jgi:hypothetical protein
MAICVLETLFVKQWFTNFELLHAKCRQLSPGLTEKDSKKFSKQTMEKVLSPKLPGFAERKAQLTHLFSKILGGGIVPGDSFDDPSKDFMWLIEHVVAEAEPALYALFHCVARQSGQAQAPLPDDWFDPAFPAMKMTDVFGAKPFPGNPALAALNDLLEKNVDPDRTFYPNADALGGATVDDAVKAILS